MRRYLKLSSVLACAALALALPVPTGQAHTSLRTYWLAVPPAYEIDTEFMATLSIVSGTTAKYTVKAANGSFTSSGTVRPNAPKTVSLPRPLMMTTTETVQFLGVKVTASAPIGVTMFSSAEGSRGATTIQPAGALGTDYVAVGYQESAPSDPSGLTSTLTLVATRADTSADVTPTCTGVGGAPAGVKIDVELDAGETWQLRCDSSQDVTGTTVTSDFPLGVFAGNTCAFIVPGSFCDQVIEQMVPTRRWGRTFFLAPLSDTESDLVRLVTGDDPVSLTVTGAAGFPTSMGAHQHVEVSLDDPVKVVSDQPLYIAQFMRGPDDAGPPPGDPLMIEAQPTSRWAKAYRFVVPSGYAFTRLTIVRRSGATVKLDGNPVTGFAPVPGGTHSYKAITTLPAGRHVLRSTAPLTAYVYGVDQGLAYGFTPGVDPVKARTRTTLAVTKTASKVKAAGRVRPHGKGRMIVKLYREQNGKWKVLATKRPRLSATSRYATGFGRPGPGRCKMTAKFPGDGDHAPSTAKKTFTC